MRHLTCRISYVLRCVNLILFTLFLVHLIFAHISSSQSHFRCHYSSVSQILLLHGLIPSGLPSRILDLDQTNWAPGKAAVNYQPIVKYSLVDFGSGGSVNLYIEGRPKLFWRCVLSGSFDDYGVYMALLLWTVNTLCDRSTKRTLIEWQQYSENRSCKAEVNIKCKSSTYSWSFPNIVEILVCCNVLLSLLYRQLNQTVHGVLTWEQRHSCRWSDRQLRRSTRTADLTSRTLV